MFEGFSGASRDAILVAKEQACEFQSPAVDTEHLLLGITLCGATNIQELLADHGVAADTVRRALDGKHNQGPLGADDAAVARARTRRTDSPNVELFPFTREAKKALELSLREAISHRQDRIDACHLVLGIMGAATPTTRTLLGGDEGIETIRQSIQKQLD